MSSIVLTVDRVTEFEEACAWMTERVPAGANTYAGYDAIGWEASVWILHAMYENRSLSSGVTHDEVRRAGIAAGEVEPLVIGGIDLEAPGTIATGGQLGRSGWPGVGWERLRWRDLALRCGVTLFGDWPYPCYCSFPFSSWPVNIVPPTEGSLDREQFVRLLEHLAAGTRNLDVGGYFAFYSAPAVDLVAPALFRGDLATFIDLYDGDEVSRAGGSPTNAWPSDRSWFIYTDWDFWGTKVNGSAELISSLVADPGLDTITLDV